MTPAAKSPYAGYRFPGEVISHAVWLYFRFPLSLRMVEEMLAARGIDVSHETVRQWGRKFGQAFANQIRRRLPSPGDKWHLDEVCLTIRGTKHWLWRAVDQDGFVLDVLVQSRRDKRAAKRLLRKLLKRQTRVPRVMVTDKLASYGAAKGDVMPSVEHRRHKGLVWGYRCQGSSSAAAFLRFCWARGRLRANPRGVRHRARVIAPQPCIRWASWGPNHDAAMRISGEAPGRRVQSEQRLSGHSLVRRTATSDHPRQLTTGRPMSAEAFTSWTAGARRSRCRAQDDALRRLAGGHEAPQGNQELPREGHDHGLARAATGVRGAGPIPLRQSAVLLEQQEAPGQLHHAATDSGVAGPGQAFLPPSGTALVWGAGQARIARHRPPVAQVAGQDLMHEHVGGLEANPDHSGQQTHHRMRPFVGLRRQALLPDVLDFLDLPHDEAQARHVAAQLGLRVRWQGCAFRGAQRLKAL